MIDFVEVTKKYPKGVVALENINMRVEQGAFISVVGKSGAGKSTMIHLISREELPTSGTVYIEGVDTSKIKDKYLPLLRRKIGIVFQDIKLLPKKTALENVSFAMEVNSIPKNEIEEEAPKLLELVGLEEKLNAFPHEMSGGETQRVAIARALAHEPVLLLADEPTGNLDEENALEVLNILKKINQMGTTVVLATHDKELVDRLKKRVIVLEDGEVKSDVKKGKYKLK